MENFLAYINFHIIIEKTVKNGLGPFEFLQLLILPQIHAELFIANGPSLNVLHFVSPMLDFPVCVYFLFLKMHRIWFSRAHIFLFFTSFQISVVVFVGLRAPNIQTVYHFFSPLAGTK